MDWRSQFLHPRIYFWDCLKASKFFNSSTSAELEGTYKGMMIALPTEDWQKFGQMNLTQLSALLKDWARLVNLSAFTSAPRKPKQKKPKPTYDPRHPHVSTARLLDKKKKFRASPESK